MPNLLIKSKESTGGICRVFGKIYQWKSPRRFSYLEKASKTPGAFVRYSEIFLSEKAPDALFTYKSKQHTGGLVKKFFASAHDT